MVCQGTNTCLLNTFFAWPCTVDTRRFFVVSLAE
jgi:hypothetical protein